MFNLNIKHHVFSDDVAIEGAMASADMVFNEFAHNIPLQPQDGHGKDCYLMTF